jgi:ADP-ribose pyrophosphatase YjhB (NUDIX family)
VGVRIPISNVFLLNRWGHPINPGRLQYQVEHGHTSPPIKTSLGTSFEVNAGDYVHSLDPQEEGVEWNHEPYLDPAHPKYFLSDGHHRVRAAQQRGESHIDAEVHVPAVPHYLGPEKAAKWNSEIGAESAKFNAQSQLMKKSEPRRRVALVVAKRDGLVLFGKRRDNGKFTLPGGHLNEGEDPVDGAVRELREETSLAPAGELKLVDERELRDCRFYTYECSVEGTPNGKNDPDQECGVWAFFDVDKGIPKDVAENMSGPKDPDKNIAMGLMGLSKAQYDDENDPGVLALRNYGTPKANDYFAAMKAKHQKLLTHIAGMVASGVQAHVFNHPKQPGTQSMVVRDTYPAAKGGEGWRVSHFDEHGPYGHSSHADQASALKEAHDRGADIFNPVPQEMWKSELSKGDLVSFPKSNPRIVDYTHRIWPQLHDAGYTMTVQHEPSTSTLHAHVAQNGRHVGTVSAPYADGKIGPVTGNVTDTDLHQIAHVNLGHRAQSLHSELNPVSMADALRDLVDRNNLEKSDAAFAPGPDYDPHNGSTFSEPPEFPEQPRVTELKDILASHRSLLGAHRDNVAGRRSHTQGPLHVHVLEDGRNLLVDGHHRLAEHLATGNLGPVHTAVVGRGYTDYYATPDSMDEADYPSFSRNFKLAPMEKREQDDEIDRLLLHPNPSERSMALKLHGVADKHLTRAFADEHPDIQRQASCTIRTSATPACWPDADAGPRAPPAGRVGAPRHRPRTPRSPVPHPQGPPRGREGRHHARHQPYPHLDPSLIETMVHEGNGDAVVENVHTPQHVIDHLIEQHFLNPSDDRKRALARRALKHAAARPEHIERAFKEGPLDVKIAVAQGPHLPEALAQDALQRGLLPDGDKDALLRTFIVQNPKASDRHLKTAANDRNPIVRHLARQRVGTFKDYQSEFNKFFGHAMKKALRHGGLQGHRRTRSTPPAPTRRPQARPGSAPAPAQRRRRRLQADPSSTAPSPSSASPARSPRAATSAARPSTRCRRTHATHGNAKFMVKPYHERVSQRLKSWQKHPHQGWAEMTSIRRCIMPAASATCTRTSTLVEHHMGEGHEAEPALVIKMDPTVEPLANYKHGSMYVPEDVKHDARKIAVMDFLSNNLDRHGGNVMARTGPVARPEVAETRREGAAQPARLDHSRSFQYANTHQHKRQARASSRASSKTASSPTHRTTRRGSAPLKYQATGEESVLPVRPARSGFRSGARPSTGGARTATTSRPPWPSAWTRSRTPRSASTSSATSTPAPTGSTSAPTSASRTTATTGTSTPSSSIAPARRPTPSLSASTGRENPEHA